MIGLDTNVLVRFLVEDDPVQTPNAIQFVTTHCRAGSPGFINRVTLCELVWVLSSGHEYRRAEIAAMLEDLAASDEFLLEDEETVRAALLIYNDSNVDFADILVAEINRARGCEATATFDRKAANLSGFIPVS